MLLPKLIASSVATANSTATRHSWCEVPTQTHNWRVGQHDSLESRYSTDADEMSVRHPTRARVFHRGRARAGTIAGVDVARRACERPASARRTASATAPTDFLTAVAGFMLLTVARTPPVVVCALSAIAAIPLS